MEEVKCKVCNQMFPLTETFCPECGFEKHIYPEPLSPELKKYEEERVNKYKEQRTKKEEELKKQEDAFDKVSSQLSEARDTLKKNEEELETAESVARVNKQKIAQLEKDLADALQEAEKSNLSDLKGIVIVSDMTHIAFSDMSAYAITPINRQCLPVLSGVNTYGSADSSGNHHQIAIKCRGDVFLPKHFAVDTTYSRGLVVKDLSNGMITLNGNRFEEEYAGNSKFFIQQGRQIFVVEIKMLNF